MLGTIEPIFIKIEVKLKGNVAKFCSHLLQILNLLQEAICGLRSEILVFHLNYGSTIQIPFPHRQCPQNNLELARASDASSVTPPVQRIPPGTTIHSLRGWPTSSPNFTKQLPTGIDFLSLFRNVRATPAALATLTSQCSPRPVRPKFV